ncbi:unnamed protein product [Linum perenne]
MRPANVLNSSLEYVSAEFAYGSGQLNPINATNPGLVYETSPQDYINLLCNLGYGTHKIRVITGEWKITCQEPNYELFMTEPQPLLDQSAATAPSKKLRRRSPTSARWQQPHLGQPPQAHLGQIAAAPPRPSAAAPPRPARSSPPRPAAATPVHRSLLFNPHQSLSSRSLSTKPPPKFNSEKARRKVPIIGLRVSDGGG